MTAFAAVTFAVGVAAVVEDLARRRISNWTTGGALVSGLAIHASQRGWHGAAVAAAGAGMGFALFLIFYLLRGMGGGDVKLMAGFGSLLGPSAIVSAAWIAAAAGGFMAAGHAAICAVRPRMAPGKGRAQADSIPYAPAIVAGAWLAGWALG